MKRLIFQFFWMIVFLASGCSSTSKTPAATPAPASTPTMPGVGEEWIIKMTHSGGIMGLMRSVEIASNGNFTVTDKRIDKTVTGKLTDEELTQLGELISAAGNFSTGGPGLGVCADCFIYDLEIQSSGKKFAVQLDDLSLPESGLETLVGFLRGIADSALK